MRTFYLFLLSVSLIFIACADEIVTSTPTVFDELNTRKVLARFSSIQEKVFDTSCALSGCHKGSVFPNLEGNAYTRIVNAGNFGGEILIKPGSPGDSYLFRKITGQDIIGSRMPQGAPPLDEVIIDSIRLWIENGALQN